MAKNSDSCLRVKIEKNVRKEKLYIHYPFSCIWSINRIELKIDYRINSCNNGINEIFLKLSSRKFQFKNMQI